jgi:anti-sigma B factor antagonist
LFSSNACPAMPRYFEELGRAQLETLIGVFVSPAAAESAVSELQRLPLPVNAITFLMADPAATEAKTGGKLMGAFLGGMFGGTAGLSLGAAAATLVVPGVGPVLAIGIGAAALLGLGGAGAGAALGRAATPSARGHQQAVAPCTTSEDAQFFRDVLSKGRSVVIVRTDSKPVAEAACGVLDRSGIGTRRTGEAPASEMAAKGSVRDISGVSIVDLSGRITLDDGAAMLRDTVRELLEQGRKNIMLSLARVTHIDSSGIGALVGALTAVRGRGGELKLVSVSQPVNEVLKITRLAGLFDVAADEIAGVASFRTSRLHMTPPG